MGKPTAKKGNINHNMGKRWKSRYCYKPREIDQINSDLAPEAACELLNQKVDQDKPGEAQHYCIHCAKYFINKLTLSIHLKTKAHKKRVKELKLSPHTPEEAERAAGKGNFIMPDERIVRDLRVSDQVRDPSYLEEQHDIQMKEIRENLNPVDKTKKKKEASVFLPVKSGRHS